MHTYRYSCMDTHYLCIPMYISVFILYANTWITWSIRWNADESWGYKNYTNEVIDDTFPASQHDPPVANNKQSASLKNIILIYNTYSVPYYDASHAFNETSNAHHKQLFVY